MIHENWCIYNRETHIYCIYIYICKYMYRIVCKYNFWVSQSTSAKLAVTEMPEALRSRSPCANALRVLFCTFQMHFFVPFSAILAACAQGSMRFPKLGTARSVLTSRSERVLCFPILHIQVPFAIPRYS